MCFYWCKPLPIRGFPDSSASKESACNAGDQGSVPGLTRSPVEWNGYPLQYSGLDNSMHYIIYGSWTQQSDFHFHFHLFSPVQFSSVALLCPILCDLMDCSTPGLPVHHKSWSLLKLISIESVRPSNHLILFCPHLLPSSIFPNIKVFSNQSVLHIKWPKYWSFSFNVSPSNEHPGLISFRMDGLDPIAVQGTLKSLLQQHSSKSSIHQHSAFFVFQLSHPYTTTGKTIALTRTDLCWQSKVSAF